MKRAVKRALHGLGYDIHRIPRDSRQSPPIHLQEPPDIQPVWPLPRGANGPSDEQILKEFARYEFWHYAYSFEGGLAFPIRHSIPSPLANDPQRPLQRFAHFMPYLLQAHGGSLQGRRVLDIACNSGFWSIQCALLGAEVVGFDARPELIEQANLVKAIVGVSNVSFRVLDFWNMSAASLDGMFDIVLSLGVLYHLPDPLEALRLTRSMARQHLLLDTAVSRSLEPLIKLFWEEPVDISSASRSGVVAFPSKSGVELMLRHLGASKWEEIPLRNKNMPADYLGRARASWLVTV